MRTRIPGAVGTLFALDMAVKQYIEENVSETDHPKTQDNIHCL